MWNTPFTNACKQGEILTIPMATWKEITSATTPRWLKLRKDNRIVFRYSSPSGELTAASNPNGSLDNIAGICSEGRNVLGMMPHPERASEPELGCVDGYKIFESLLDVIVAK